MSHFFTTIEFVGMCKKVLAMYENKRGQQCVVVLLVYWSLLYYSAAGVTSSNSTSKRSASFAPISWLGAFWP